MCRCDDPPIARAQVADDEPTPLPRPATVERQRGPIARGHRYAPLPSGVRPEPGPFHSSDGRYFASAADRDREEAWIEQRRQREAERRAAHEDRMARLAQMEAEVAAWNDYVRDYHVRSRDGAEALT